VDARCKYHEPYPKAMCNKCIPPNVIVKRQEYRHVDYVEFMNIGQIQNFVKYWVQKKHTAEQRVGYLYGYYAEDPHYKGGIRVIVEAIYEPDQMGTYSDFQIKENLARTHRADFIANGLSLERVGWIYTETNHDTVMDEKKLRMAARMQEDYRVMHSSGYEISNYITVILRSNFLFKI
jgi:nuclear protein localization family protein 4